MAKFIIKEEGLIAKFLGKVFDSILQHKTDRLKAQLHSDPALVQMIEVMERNAEKVNAHILANRYKSDVNYHGSLEEKE